MHTEDRATSDALMRSIVVLVFVVSVTGVMFFTLFNLTNQFNAPQDSRLTGGAYSNISSFESNPQQPTIYITTLQSDLPLIRVGEQFNFELSATGGTGDYTWSLEQPLGSGYLCTGRLPKGLKLSNKGIITGVAQTQETCIVGIKVSSPNSKPAKFDFAIRVS